MQPTPQPVVQGELTFEQDTPTSDPARGITDPELRKDLQTPRPKGPGRPAAARAEARWSSPPSPNFEGRDEALATFELTRPAVVAELQSAAFAAWRQHQAPVSVNDIRYMLTFLDYHGDPRILGAAFPKRDWEPVGHTMVAGGRAHARQVRTFRPRFQ